VAVISLSALAELLMRLQGEDQVEEDPGPQWYENHPRIALLACLFQGQLLEQ
jgi:hypothetical protein